MESTLRRGASDEGLRLIETLGWDGTGFVRMDMHMARLHASAARLGWACDLAAVETALVGAVSADPARIRLTLGAKGDIDVVASPFPVAAPSWQIGLAAQKLMSGDPWLSVKSTRRDSYDQARSSLAGGYDEMVFQNERGEVCDGSITTVFFDRGHGLCTPPLSSGLLPGILRTQMIATGAARESVLMASELSEVRLWVGNSLRGMIRAIYS
jgi:4-amino-4-deoxychorismate lyase